MGLGSAFSSFMARRLPSLGLVGDDRQAGAHRWPEAGKVAFYFFTLQYNHRPRPVPPRLMVAGSPRMQPCGGGWPDQSIQFRGSSVPVLLAQSFRAASAVAGFVQSRPQQKQNTWTPSASDGGPSPISLRCADTGAPSRGRDLPHLPRNIGGTRDPAVRAHVLRALRPDFEQGVRPQRAMSRVSSAGGAAFGDGELPAGRASLCCFSQRVSFAPAASPRVRASGSCTCRSR